MTTPQERPVTVYEAVGGRPFFESMIGQFYAGIEGDELLRPLYPEDLTDAIDHMVGFMVQYWGGPSTYSEQRGHPRLRMRHAPFMIREAEKDAWLSHMTPAVDSACGTLDPAIADQVAKLMHDYFQSAATHLINAPG